MWLAECLLCVDALFLNAHNVQAIHQPVNLLRKLGIPSIAIVDLDFIQQKGPNWRSLINACQIPESLHDHIDKERNYFVNIFANLSLNKDEKKAIKYGGRCLYK